MWKTFETHILDRFWIGSKVWIFNRRVVGYTSTEFRRILVFLNSPLSQCCLLSMALAFWWVMLLKMHRSVKKVLEDPTRTKCQAHCRKLFFLRPPSRPGARRLATSIHMYDVVHTLFADSEIRMDDEKRFPPDSLKAFYFSMKTSQRRV